MTQQDPAQAAGPAPGAGGNTGDTRVNEALGKLADLDGLPVHDHPAVFSQMYEALTDALGALEVTPDPAAPDPAAPDPAAPDPAAPDPAAPDPAALDPGHAPAR